MIASLFNKKLDRLGVKDISSCFQKQPSFLKWSDASGKYIFIFSIRHINLIFQFTQHENVNNGRKIDIFTITPTVQFIVHGNLSM